MTRQTTGTEAQIKDLDPSWKPASLRLKADAKTREALTTRGEFAAKIFPIIKKIRSAGVKTHQGICGGLERRGGLRENGGL